MRELKFRAWDKNEKKMSWTFTLYETPTWEWNGGGYSLSDDDFAKSPIMQFTGLLDKNGVEIYEKDIVRSEEFGAGTVFWNKGSFWIREHSPPENNNYSGLWSPCLPVEVIGNVFENPEYL